MSYKPVINGLRTGSLVEITGVQSKPGAENINGQIGQLGHYCHERDEFHVTLLNGFSADFKAEHVAEARSLGKPGEGGTDDSFDLVLGPESAHSILAEEIAMCLFEKGFCVIRLIQGDADIADTLEGVRLLGDDGLLNRLPEEVEEHYLGVNAKGKIMWLDQQHTHVEHDELLKANDDTLTLVASLIQPYLEDCLGSTFTERTPALLCHSLVEGEEVEFPNLPADDKTLGIFLGTWRRQMLKAQLFMGPGDAKVTLERNEGKVQGPPKLSGNVDLSAGVGTLLLYRPDCINLECVMDDETLMMVTSYLKPAPQMVFDKVTGDLEALLEAQEGPAAPPGDALVNIMSMGVKMSGNWDTPEDFFSGLLCCTDTVTRIPFRRFDIDVYLCTGDFSTMQGWQTYAQHTSIVEGAELFDNKEFEISTMEAQGMDVRQRHVLEVGCKALAGIGVTKKSQNRQVLNVGVSVGTDGHEWPFIPKGDLGACGNSSNALGITANRFSFVYNFRGPNYLIDTACSASLTAAHFIKLSLIERRWDPLDFCVAMGTQIFLDVGGFVGCGQAHMLSTEGRCKTFNASADGYLRGDGTNGYVMKYGNFKEDRYGLLRGSNVNQDGRSASLTAPSGPAQEQCIWGAIREAQMLPPESTCWDCHGTGTSLGDPIEVGAVRKVQIKQERSEPLMVASLKANTGHLEGGAAMSAMIKCILQISSTKCCPTGHFRSLNPHLEHSVFNAIFQSEAANFHYNMGHSQVSSFGFGGSNGHAVFWGESFELDNDALLAFERRLRRSALPEVRPVGSNPEDWDSDYPAADAKAGDRYTVTVRQEDTLDTPIRWVRDMPDAPEEEAEEEETYEITGNFNDWESDRMITGLVPGSFTTTVVVPDSGVLEFRFLRDGDIMQVLAPETAICSRRSARVLGPDSGLTNKWSVQAEPESEIEVQLLVTKDCKSVMWMKPTE